MSSKVFDFSYLADKVKQASFTTEPFKHIYIEDFFTPQHFEEITQSPEIAIRPASNDKDLIDALYRQNYQVITFPGTTTDVDAYLAWHNNRTNSAILNQDTCEGFGVTMRLQKTTQGTILDQLYAFLRSQSFWNTLSAKFGLDLPELTTDVGIQKYLDGYEISPHPDIRRKALTFMANINPSDRSAEINYHTRYMTFKPERDYVREFWTRNQDIDRCWIPWDWCETRSQQTKNNTIVIFSPSNDTIHAVKASYDHLQTQRTQLYGNLWFKEQPVRGMAWRDLNKLVNA